MQQTFSALQPLPSLSPPLKWAGGKRWLIPHIEALWRKYESRRLVEPFVGGMAVSLGLKPEKALLNDSNKHLINFYRFVKAGLLIETPLVNDRELYYQYRERFNFLVLNEFPETAEVASLFYYLNRTCYNGLCRFNSKGEFNVPFGKYKKINYQTDFRDYQSLFTDWELVSGDFEDIVLQKDDFIYADPPYDVVFRSYTPTGFDWDDQVRLVKWLVKHTGPVVVSNQATERIVELYTENDFKIEIINAPRMISCDGNRTPAQEILAVKGF